MKPCVLPWKKKKGSAGFIERSSCQSSADRLKGYTPVVPNQMGIHVLPYIPLEEIIPYIHWTFFFTA